MDMSSVAQRYFNAWNSHDTGAIVATFAESGTYSDPVSGELSRQAIAAYAAGLFEAFPDLSFEIVSHGQTDDRTFAAQWVMRGTNTGAFKGMPPSGRPICVPGADFIVVEGGRICSLHGYFDSRAVPDQLGLQVIVQPRAIGPVSFGYSTSMQGGRTGMPGAFSMTSLQVRSDAEGKEVYEHSRMILRDVAKMDGFIGSLTANVGQRYYTAVAWDLPEHSRQIHQSNAHNEIVAKLYNSDFASGGAFGVWVPLHQAHLVRCTQCRRMCDIGNHGNRCTCGVALPDPPPYW
jgi:steroid delta-isomerase-like uncharacterized protein